MQEILKLATTTVGSDLSAVQSYIDDIKDQATRQVAAKMKEALDTTKDRIAAVIEANTGKPTADIAKALTEKFKEMSEGRAKTIARTTVKAQATTTQEEAWDNMNKRESDPKRKIVKVWLTQRDGDVRPSHQKLDGKPVEAGGSFGEGVGRGPGLGEDPGEAINCRCTLRAVRASKLGM
jgi:hypothetical protein